MTRLIKKYKNRRLYDTELSQYITMEDLQHYVVDGLIFRVEDSTHNRDITSATLLQIFVEMESGATKFLSPDMLRQLIIITHHPMNQSFKSLLENVFTALEQPVNESPFLKGYKEMTDAWQKNIQKMVADWQGFFKKG